MPRRYLIFLLSFFTTFSIVIGHVAYTCYRYDPANLFSDRAYEAGIARHLAEGRNVANVTDYDERLLQKFFVERLTESRDVLVLGSSRAMNIGAELFPGRTFFNASVSGAALEDDYAILQIYREHGRSPRLVVLGLDPWIFNRNNLDPRWRSLEAEYLRSLQKNAGLPDSPSNAAGNLRRFQQLLNIDYYRAARKVKSRGNKDYYPTDATQLDVNIRMADGTISYSRTLAQRSAVEVAEAARKEAAAEPVYYPLARYDALDPAYAEMLGRLLDRLKADKVEVLVFMAPYHPEMYAALVRPGSRYQLVPAAEEQIRRICAERGVPVLGSYNPAVGSCRPGEFYDGMHPRPGCIARLMAGSHPESGGVSGIASPR